MRPRPPRPRPRSQNACIPGTDPAATRYRPRQGRARRARSRRRVRSRRQAAAAPSCSSRERAGNGPGARAAPPPCAAAAPGRPRPRPSRLASRVGDARPVVAGCQLAGVAERLGDGHDLGTGERAEPAGGVEGASEERGRVRVRPQGPGAVAGDARVAPRRLVALGLQPVERQQLGGFVRRRRPRLDRLRGAGVQLLAPLERQPLVGGVAHETVREPPPDGGRCDKGAETGPERLVECGVRRRAARGGARDRNGHRARPPPSAPGGRTATAGRSRPPAEARGTRAVLRRRPHSPAVRSNSRRNNGFPSARSTIAADLRRGQRWPVATAGEASGRLSAQRLELEGKDTVRILGQSRATPRAHGSARRAGADRGPRRRPCRASSPRPRPWRGRLRRRGLKASTHTPAGVVRRSARGAAGESAARARRPRGSKARGRRRRRRARAGTARARARARRRPAAARAATTSWGASSASPSSRERLGGTAGTASRSPYSSHATRNVPRDHRSMASDTRRDLPMPGAPTDLDHAARAGRRPASARRKNLLELLRRARRRADRRRSLPRRRGGAPRGPPPRRAPTFP